jgi:hypothetical protein
MEPAPAAQDGAIQGTPDGSSGSRSREAGLGFRTFGERPHRRLALLLQLTEVAIKNSADVHAWNPYMRMIREGKPRIPLNQVNLVQGGVRISGTVVAVGWEETEAPAGGSLRAIVEEMDREACRLLDELFADIQPPASAPPDSGPPGQDPWAQKRELMQRAVGFLVYRAPAAAFLA